MSPSDGAVPPSADRGPSRARLATWFGVGALRVWLCRINGLQHWPGVGRWGEAKWTGGHRSGPFPVLTPTRNQLQCRPPPPQRRAWPSTSCGPPTPPPLLCSPAPKGQGIRANVPLGAVDRDTAALVPAAVGVSGHEAAMAAPAVDLTQVQGHLAHLPLGAHIQLPLEGEQDSGQLRAPGPNTHF